MENEKQDTQQGAGAQAGAHVTRADTLAEGSAVPVQGTTGKVGADIVGAAGGTDAAAGARMSGGSGPGGLGLRGQADAAGSPGTPGGNVAGENVSPAAGAGAAGGSGLGEAASADDTRADAGGGAGQSSSLAAGGDPSGGNTLSGNRPGKA